MSQFRALGGLMLLAAAVLFVPTGVGAQTPTCNLKTPPCPGVSPFGCGAPCPGPIAVQHASNFPCDTAAAPGAGGAFNLRGTEFQDNCSNNCFGGSAGCPAANQVVPQFRFWQYGSYATANSGCASQTPADAWICNGKLDFPAPGAGNENGHWFFFQGGWGQPATDGCIVTPGRTVAELSFVDTPSENTPGHKSWYIVASVNDSAAGFDFDRITGALTCNGRTDTNDVPAKLVPGLTVDARAGACTGAPATRTQYGTPDKNAIDGTFFDVPVTLANTAPDYYDETGKNQPTNKLIAGLQILYSKQAAGVEPMSSNPFDAKAVWTPVRDPAAPSKALGLVTTAKTKISLPQGAKTDDYYLATRIVYTDPLSPSGQYDPATVGPLVTSKMSGHCGPVFFSGIVLAVEFDKVTAERTATGVKVSWTTVSEDDTTGFVVRRATEPTKAESTWSQIGSYTESKGPSRYSVEDTGTDARTTYYYYVEEQTSHGPGSRSSAVKVEGLAQPVTGVTGGRGRSSRRAH